MAVGEEHTSDCWYYYERYGGHGEQWPRVDLGEATAPADWLVRIGDGGLPEWHEAAVVSAIAERQSDLGARITLWVAALRAQDADHQCPPWSTVEAEIRARAEAFALNLPPSRERDAVRQVLDALPALPQAPESPPRAPIVVGPGATSRTVAGTNARDQRQ